MFVKRNLSTGGIVLSLLAVLIITLSACSGDKKGDIQKTSGINSEDKTSMDLLKLMDETAERLVAHMEKSEVLEARSDLMALSQQILKFRFEGATSIYGLDALTQTVISAERVFNAVKFSHDAGMKTALQVRLAVDALTHPEKPLWLQYDRTLSDDLLLMKQLVVFGKVPQAAAASKQMYEHFQLIRPAIVISRDSSFVEGIQSLFGSLDKQWSAKSTNLPLLEQTVDDLETLLDQLFHRSSRTTLAGISREERPLLWTLFIGSFIIVVLSYVGWTKYRHNRIVTTARTNQDKNRDVWWTE